LRFLGVVAEVPRMKRAHVRVDRTFQLDNGAGIAKGRGRVVPDVGDVIVEAVPGSTVRA
jgi:hypothetical protein